MNNIRARRACKKLLLQAFFNAGFVEGITLTNQEIKKTQDTLFWHGVVKDTDAREKLNYVTYEIVSSDEVYRADNSVYLREVVVAVDVFSKTSFDSKSNDELLEKLEDALTGVGFEVEFYDELYETETLLYHMPITIYKFY